MIIICEIRLKPSCHSTGVEQARTGDAQWQVEAVKATLAIGWSLYKFASVLTSRR